MTNAHNISSLISIEQAPQKWKYSCVHEESHLHQLSPFIGKLKSSIARDLIIRFSQKGDLIADPFSGSGTIPLEATIAGRHVFASDISIYSSILTKAKLFPPRSVKVAINRCESLLRESRRHYQHDLRCVPKWVRAFFNPKTLREILAFAEICRNPGNEFYMACLLGILHHQRPGFLSHPSSHLVPYLRNRKFPPDIYPELYEYRPLEPRIIAKIERALVKPPDEHVTSSVFRRGDIHNIKLPESIDCIITSPPYMNALDYVRDNRLRLWLIAPSLDVLSFEEPTSSRHEFINTMSDFFIKTEATLKHNRHCVLIVGETVGPSACPSLSETLLSLAKDHAPSLVPIIIVEDTIPDVRRSRRACHGVKNERILVFRRK